MSHRSPQDPLALRAEAGRGLADSHLPGFLSPQVYNTVGLVEVTRLAGTEELKSG